MEIPSFPPNKVVGRRQGVETGLNTEFNQIWTVRPNTLPGQIVPNKAAPFSPTVLQLLTFLNRYILLIMNSRNCIRKSLPVFLCSYIWNFLARCPSKSSFVGLCVTLDFSKMKNTICVLDSIRYSPFSSSVKVGCTRRNDRINGIPQLKMGTNQPWLF